jgi:hypothetical protein
MRLTDDRVNGERLRRRASPVANGAKRGDAEENQEDYHHLECVLLSVIICPAQMAQLGGRLNPDQSRTASVYRDDPVPIERQGRREKKA